MNRPVGRPGPAPHVPDLRHRGGRRFADLYEITNSFIGAATVAELLEAYLARALSVLDAAAGAVHLLEDNALVMRGSVGWPERETAIFERIELDADVPATIVWRTGQPTFVESRDEMAATYPQVAWVQEAVNDDAWAIVPIIAEAGVDGVLGMSFVTPQTFTAADREALTHLGHQFGAALDRLRVAEHTATVTAILERSFRPRPLPAIGGYRFSATYAPASSPVGGDWYGAFAVDDRINLVVGDVAGHGLAAADEMQMLRIATRAYCRAGCRPHETLELLSTFADGEDVFGTLFVGELDPTTGTLRYSNAGHVPPVIASSGAARELASGIGPPIGPFPGHRYPERVEELRVGETLALYTDGLIERRGETLDDGIARVCRVLATSTPDASAVVEACMRTAPPDHDDDACLLLLTRDE